MKGALVPIEVEAIKRRCFDDEARQVGGADLAAPKIDRLA